MSHPSDERIARKTYVRERQIRVFAIVITLLLVALVTALLFFFNAFGLGVSPTAAVLPNHGVVAPCAPKTSEDEPATYPANEAITVRVLNGTGFPRLGRAVGEALKNRNFVINTIETYQTDSVERTTIYFGRNSIAEAYTVNANFTDAQLVMDDREDKLIDVVIGATFQDLTDLDQIPKAGSEITSIDSCQDPETMTDLPKAIDHPKVD